MRRKILLFFLAIFSLSGVLLSVFSATSISKIRGSFTPTFTWTGGHPGKVLFDIGALSSGSTATRDQYGYLSGYFWLGNVGWATFSQDYFGGTPLCRPKVTCPADILKNPHQACPVVGCAWSQNAGWIVLSGSMIGGAETGVYYNPSTGLIEGWGWSKSLGWVPFYAKTSSEIATNATITGVTMDGISIEFVGKIAVIGNIAGSRIFDLPNQNIGYVFNLSRHAAVMNTIKQNIAIMTRNVSDLMISDTASPLNFLIQKDSDYNLSIWPVGKKSIIVIGHDIVLDTTNDIGDPNNTSVRALIALKDREGNGGNIIITDKVKRIYSLLYAEGSIFSGEKTSTGYIDKYISSGPWNIPQNQLYIKGLLVSKNTISGARQIPIVCPVTTGNCDQATAELYDLNYFRTFDPNESSQKSVPYSDPRLDRASMIIEYNDAVFSDIPPGLANSLQ